MSIHICKTVAYPMAKVLQSAAGASDVIAIWSIVLAEMCSEVVGSNRITFPWALPRYTVSVHHARNTLEA